MEKAKKTVKHIYTVIITEMFEYEGGDVSTVSFTRFDDALEYCLGEIGDDEDARQCLEEDMYYSNGNAKYYIEEAKLIG